MNIFNSLGSNYDFNFVLKALFSTDKTTHSSDLSNFLENKYKGKSTLLYKGREAIELGLKLLNLPAGSFVAINGFTCFAVYKAIKNARLEVEYLDIEKGELNFSAKILEESIKKNPQIKVVIIQNTLGYPCEIADIAKLCKEKKIYLMEDLAHCVGTKYSYGVEAGKIGDLVIFSFSQDKIIDGISGGALIKKTDIENPSENIPIKKQLTDRLYPLFTYLVRNTYQIGIGKIIHYFLKSFRLLSGPMDTLDNQLHLLPDWYCNLINFAFNDSEENLAHRKEIALTYAKLINPKVLSPKISSAINLSSNLRFPIFVRSRESLIKHLKQFGVYVSDIWYDAPIAPKKYLSQTDYKGQCPNAELASEAILNLPTNQTISENDAEQISQLINQWLLSR